MPGGVLINTLQCNDESLGHHVLLEEHPLLHRSMECKLSYLFQHQFTAVQVDKALHVQQLACEELFFWPKVLTAVAFLHATCAVCFWPNAKEIVMAR